MSSSQEPYHSLKRDHDSFDFNSLVDLESPFTVPTNLSQTYAPQSQEPDLDSGESSIPTPPVSVGTNKLDPSPARSRSASLTDAGSRTPSLRGDSPVPGTNLMSSALRASPSPSAFAALNGSAPPPAKKPKLSFAEREAEKEIKRIAREIRDREIAEEKARREQARQAQADDKARREAEKEAERRKREAEREQKRAALEAEKAAKEEKRRRREEEKLEKQRAEEEKRKKDGKQKTLSSFFPTSAAVKSIAIGERRSESPAPSNTSLLAAAAATPAALTPSKLQKTAYEMAFGDFFIKEHVSVAPVNRFERDDQATESLHCTIDSYLLADRSPGRSRHFDAIDLFHLSGQNNAPRGKRCMSVREIMAEMSGKSKRPIDLTTDSQNTQIKRTNDLLRKIPLKFLKFQEDVRPPYRGTFTSRPINGMARLARNPLRRDLPDTNYDYDSEAEWVEDEDAEDLNSEGDEDEDVGEDGEDMEGFLDDENDETTNSKRLVLQGDLEPVSTGLCWEDHHKRSTNVKMMPYRMEIIIDHTMKTIDPFSRQYWEPTPPAHATMDPPRIPLNVLKANSSTVNGISNASKPVKPFFASASDLLKLNPALPPQSQLSTHPTPIPPHSTGLPLSLSTSAIASAANSKPKKLVPAEDMNAFKQEIEGSNLSKIGLIEVLKKKFPGRSGAAIKTTLEMVAKRVGSKEVDKRWVLVNDSGVA